MEKNDNDSLQAWTNEEYFLFEPKTGTIIQYSKEGPKDVVIPAKINGVAVRSIGKYAFAIAI